MRKIPKLFKVVSGLQKAPSLCSFIYLQLFKFACGSDTGSIVPVMLKESRDSVSLGRRFSGWSPGRKRRTLWQVLGYKDCISKEVIPFPLPFYFQFLPYYSTTAYARWKLSVSSRIKKEDAINICFYCLIAYRQHSQGGPEASREEKEKDTRVNILP